MVPQKRVALETDLGSDFDFATKEPANAVIFPVVMHGCVSWTVKKAEC